MKISKAHAFGLNGILVKLAITTWYDRAEGPFEEEEKALVRAAYNDLVKLTGGHDLASECPLENWTNVAV